jgi:hypothetical protein
MTASKGTPGVALDLPKILFQTASLISPLEYNHAFFG